MSTRMVIGAFRSERSDEVAIGFFPQEADYGNPKEADRFVRLSRDRRVSLDSFEYADLEDEPEWEPHPECGAMLISIDDLEGVLL